MYCKECGNKFKNEKAVVCVHCGTNKGQGNNYCSECGTEVKNKDVAEVCLNCGCKLKNSKINIPNSLKGSDGTSKPIGNSKVVAGISAILLGAIGIHNFYLGYKEKGFIQLSIFLVAVFIFGPIVLVNNIWSIVDAVNIFRGKMKTVTGEELV
ncbi:NINE protein [Clostridium perfringens]|nr:NINE protein [Clostridium perfringens]